MKKTKSKSTPNNLNWYQSKRLFWIGLAIISLTYIIIYPQIFDPKVADLEDNTYYYLLGHSLADGNGYTDEDGSLHMNKPPIVPIINSIIITLGGDIVAIKATNGVLLFLSLVMIYWLLFKMSKNVLLAFTTVFLISLNESFLFSATLMMAETPYLFFAILCLYLFQYFDSHRQRNNIPLIIGICLSAVIAQQTRTIGTVIIIALVLTLLINSILSCKDEQNKSIKTFFTENKFNFIAIASLVIVFFAASAIWKGYTSQFRIAQGISYKFADYYKTGFKIKINEKDEIEELKFNEYGYWLKRISENLTKYTFRIIPNTMFWNHVDSFRVSDDHQLAFGLYAMGLRDKGKDVNWAEILLGSVVLVFIVIGSIQYRRKSIFMLYFMFICGTIVVLCLMPEQYITEGFRYTQSIAPFLLFFFLAGLTKSAQWLTGKFSKSNGLQTAIAPIVIAVFLAVVMPHYVLALQIEMENAAIRHPDPNSNVDFNTPYHKQFLDYLTGCSWIKHNVPDSNVIGFRKPKIYMIYTGSFKKSIYFTMPPFNSTPEEVIEYFDKWKIEYLLLDTWYSHAYHTIVPAIQKYPEKFKILQEIGGDIPNGINPTYVVQYDRNGFEQALD